LHLRSCRQLASSDLDFAYARRPAIWFKRRTTPPDQCCAACHQLLFVVGLSVLHDQIARAERFCCGALCSPSVARRIGGMDLGAERCTKYVVRSPDIVGIRWIRSPSWTEPVSSFSRAVRFGTDGKTDAGDASVRDVVTRLVATGPNPPFLI